MVFDTSQLAAGLFICDKNLLKVISDKSSIREGRSDRGAAKRGETVFNGKAKCAICL